MDLCLSETRAGEYHQDYRHVFLFEKLRSQTVLIYTKTQNRRFQIPLVCRTFPKISVFVTD